jgi:hypothetical protein
MSAPPKTTRTKTSAEIPAAQSPGTQPAPARKTRVTTRVMIAACGGVVLILFALVAVLRPDRHAEAPVEEPAGNESEDVVADDGLLAMDAAAAPLAAESPASRPREGAGIAALVAADAAYDSGDFARARDLYLELLLSGGDLGAGGDPVLGWAHGRLALSLAKVARKSAETIIDEPPLRFRGGER